MTGIFKITQNLETREATQEVRSVLTWLLYNSVLSTSFIKLLDKGKKAHSRQALERRLRKTIKLPKLKKDNNIEKSKHRVIKSSKHTLPKCVKFLRTES
jgi:hypothetical protein